MDSISRQDMDGHIAAGRAHAWTRPLAGAVPAAALFDNRWYVARADDPDHYQPAPPELADILTTAEANLAEADRALARASAPPA